MEDDLHGIIDIRDRRPIQNRLSQRKRRERLKQMRDVLTISGEQGSPDGSSCSPMPSSRAASELSQFSTGGSEIAIDDPTIFPNLLDTRALLTTEQFMEPLMSFNAHETPIDIANSHPSGYDKLGRRDVLDANSNFTPNASVYEAFPQKKVKILNPEVQAVIQKATQTQANGLSSF